MTQPISDFSDAQINAVQGLVNERFGEQVELHLGDGEIQIDPIKSELTECPVIFWNARKCNFVVIKTGEDQFRAQYFYTPHEQASTHQAFFTTVEDCVLAVLREQSDDQLQAEGVANGATGADLN